MIISQSVFTTLFLSARFTDRELLFAAIGSFKKKHRGEYTSAGSYARKMYSPEHYAANDPGADVTIPRIRFKDGHGHHRHATHAITADILIPCSSGTIRLVLTVMHACLHRDCTVAKLCERFNIAHSTFYSWKRMFEAHSAAWNRSLGAAVKLCADLLSAMRSIPALPYRFLGTFGVSFLQSRYRDYSPPAPLTRHDGEP